MTEERHLHYYKLVDAITSEGCPICNIVEKSIECFFNNILYESVNDIGFRREFDSAGGFCNYHAYQLVGYHDVLATTLLYQSVVQRCINALKAMKSHGNKKQKSACPVCAVIADVESRFILNLRRYLIEDCDIIEKYKHSWGLCIPHLEMFLESQHQLPSWFAEFHIQILAELASSMSQYISYCNASISTDKKKMFTREEIVALHHRIVSILYGYRGMNYRGYFSKK
jgi:hypothetical protein